MFRPVRTLISLGLLAGLVWFSFAVELGDMTLAEHLDTIGDTPEAKHLLEGTRATVNPAIEDVRDRMFGEYVEAPTAIGELASSRPEPTEPSAAPVQLEPTLPGRRARRALALRAVPQANSSDPDPIEGSFVADWLAPTEREPTADLRVSDSEFAADLPELPGY